MKKQNRFFTTAWAALAALVGLVGSPARADNMASLVIAPGTGAVTLTPRWVVGPNLGGFHFMAQDLGVGGGPNQFYSLKSTPIPSGGDTSAFTRYLAATGAATAHADVGSKLTPNFYSALTSADPDLGFGSVQMYFIHHKNDGDYFSHLVPGSGTASAVADLKPMSQPGGPSTGGASGYFGLTFAASNLGYGSNVFYYLRNDAVTGNAKFGTLIPALAGASADRFDLGAGRGYNALVFSGAELGYGVEKMYYLRLDPITGFSVLGTLNPGNGRADDIANLGSVFSTLTFVPGDVGFGTNRFYTTGAVNPNWQSVSFAAIADRAISAGSFAVNPSASSALPVTLKVVEGSVGAASITGPVAGVYTVSPTAPGLITLQATQAGQASPAFEYNMLRQSFTATGAATLQITTQPLPRNAVAGTSATFTAAAAGTSAVAYRWRRGGLDLPAGNASATTATLVLANVQVSDGGTYDVVVTNLSGSLVSNAVTLTVAGGAPVITNSPLTVAGTVGVPLSFALNATNSPASYSASPLPAGLALNPATGAITGTPTVAGTTAILLGATNGTGTGNATLTVTVAAAGVAPIITNNPLTAAGTVGTSLGFTITASGSPASYSASPLPAGLALNPATGAITGTPTIVGTTAILLGATNGTGTGNATLTLTVAAAGVAPIITNSPLAAAATVGTPFGFTITASGSPTSYSASPLPPGLGIVAATGVITGTPTIAGTTVVVLGATNATGTRQATLTLTVAAAGVAPIIANGGSTSAGTAGTPFNHVVAASGSPTSYGATGLPPGLVLNAATGAITGTPTASGTFTVTLTATNAAGAASTTLTLVIGTGTLAPVIVSPVTAPGAVGSPFPTYVIQATGQPTHYSASGLPPGLSVDALTGAINGTPAVAGTFVVTLFATNATGTTSVVISLAIASQSAVPSSRIIAFSARAISGPGSQTLIVGFVVDGSGKNLLVRGVGPSLAGLGIVNVLADPLLTLYGHNGPIAVNDDWHTPIAQPAGAPAAGSGVLIAATAAQAGMFPLPAGSKDAALLFTLGSGAHTTGLLRPNSTTGVALTEIYDTDPLSSPSRLVGVSARMNVTAGEGTLIAGLVIAGDAPKTLVIRGVGPTLAALGVTGVLADPKITVYRGATMLATNDNWHAGANTVAEMDAAFARVGDFPLPGGSKDAALLVTLPPGNYTVHVTGADGGTGVALIEVYDLQ